MNDKITYDEFQQVGTDYSDTLNVNSYDKYMQSIRDYKEEAKSIIELLNLDKQSEILEIGTGTGHFSFEASKYVKSVTAFDVSQKMLDYAKKKSEAKCISNIKWIRKGFLSLDDFNKYDAVITKAALHHLPDFWKIVGLKNIINS